MNSQEMAGTSQHGRSPRVASPNMSVEQIQEQLERNRRDIDETLSAIEQRLSPGELTQDLLEYASHSAVADYGRNLSTAARENPLPLALMGISMAWLMMSGSAGNGAQQRSHGIRDSAGNLVHSAHEGYEHAKERVASGVASTQQGLRSSAGRVGDLASATRARASQLRAGTRQAWEEHPVLLGALGLAVGAGIAALLPHTRKEDEMLGETRDRMISQIRKEGRQEAGNIADLAREASRAAAQNVERRGADGEARPARFVTDAADAAAEETQARRGDNLERHEEYPRT